MTTVAVVTGAGRGMGRACAEILVGDVDVNVLVDRDEGLRATAHDELAGQPGSHRRWPTGGASS